MQKKFVIVPIDKCGNNLAIICKSYYIKKTLEEVGFYDKENDTYAPSKKHADEMIFENIEICNKLNIEVEDKHQTLPIIYWIPKLHKKTNRGQIHYCIKIQL